MAVLVQPLLLYCFVLGICIRFLTNKFRTHLRAVPGPFLAGFTDLWRFQQCLFGSMHKTQVRLHREFSSSLIRVGPASISVSNPTLIPHIYGPGTELPKSNFFPLFTLPQNKQFIPSLFSSLDPEYHKKIRSAINQVYWPSNISRMVPRMEAVLAEFTNLLADKARCGEEIDLALYLQRYAFDATSNMTFGQSLGFLQSSSDIAGIMADLRWKFHLAAAVGQIPVVAGFLRWNPLLLLLFDGHPIVRLANDRMRTRGRVPNDESSYTSTFMDMCYEASAKNPGIVNDRAIRMYCVENMIAGSETTAISLQTFIYVLIANPHVLARLLSEIESNIGGNVKRMPYISACIDELFRMHPVLGLPLERVTRAGGAYLDGYFVPEGTIVGINPWVAARDERVFGSNVESFDPDRWLNASPSQRAAMKTAMISFGAGVRSCIGKDLVILHIVTVVSHLFRHFHFHFAQKDQQSRTFGGLLIRRTGYSVLVNKRGDPLRTL